MRRKKTAFVLGGGGSRGAYEIGVWQALMELDIQIDMVMGTSVGAINSAMIAQNDFELALRLWKELETSMVFDVNIEKPLLHLDVGGMSLDEILAYAREILRNGGAGNSGLLKILNNYIREQAVRTSFLEYGLVTAELPDFKPHHLFRADIPLGKLADFIAASASCFPAVKSYEIDGVQYVDGGYADNIPVSMAIARGAERVIAVDLQAVGHVREEDLRRAKNLTMIKSRWDLGNFLVFEPDNSKRIIRLGYLDAMKALDVYDGDYYTFIRGEFKGREQRQADAAAKVFTLDSLVLYQRETLNERLSDAVSEISREIRLDKKLLTDKTVRQETLELLSRKVSTANLTLFIAEHLQDSPGRSNIFHSRPAERLLSQEIDAAEYLVRNQLL